MKNTMRLLAVAAVIVLLSGCSQLSEFFEGFTGEKETDATEVGVKEDETAKKNQEDDLAEADEEDVSDETKETEITHVEQERPEAPIPFDEKLRQEGYNTLLVPNGFPFEVPYHFILVADNQEEAGARAYEAQFCFYLPLELEKVASLIGGFSSADHQTFDEDSDVLLKTTYTSDLGDGTIDYYLDQHENTCAFFTWEIAGAVVGDVFMGFGEDPSTMVSDEELAAEEEDDSADSSSAENNALLGQKVGSAKVPENYAEIIRELTDPGSDLNEEADVIESVEAKIRSGEYELEPVVQGLPTIFPYEWFPLAGEDEFMNSRWNRTYCTDMPLKNTMHKHLTLLEMYGAEISLIELNESRKMNQFGQVNFAFNDDYSTGSWRGESLLYVDRLNEFQTHQCIQVTMEFSSQHLPE